MTMLHRSLQLLWWPRRARRAAMLDHLAEGLDAVDEFSAADVLRSLAAQTRVVG